MPRIPTSAPSFDARRTWLRWAAALVILASLVLVARQAPVQLVLDRVGQLVDADSPLALAAFVLVYVVATLVMLPGAPLSLLAGAMFGIVAGTAVVSVGSTLGAALAFLVGRHLARERVKAWSDRWRVVGAIDAAIAGGGWKFVVLLRLSPAVPFNVQNYLYGLTPLRFWPYVLASWLAMLPGTFLYVYAGATAVAVASGGLPAWQWWLMAAGLAATLGATVWIAVVARQKLREMAGVDPQAAAEEDERECRDARIAAARDAADTQRHRALPPVEEAPAAKPGRDRGTWVLVAVAGLLLAAAITVTVAPGVLRIGPPPVEMQEAYADDAGTATIDHALWSTLLAERVDADGYVDYAGWHADAGATAGLDAYLARVADAPFEQLSRDGKLTLLINAYNACTVRLILDYWPVASIRDIPADARWKAVRWTVGRRRLSLDGIEHEQIRPNFNEPRIHFVLVCAAVGCPPLRQEAYTADRLESQLADHSARVHASERWFDYDRGSGEVRLTELYSWYRGDFRQAAGSVIDYAARYSPALREALESGRRPREAWIPYDWSINAQSAR